MPSSFLPLSGRLALCAAALALVGAGPAQEPVVPEGGVDPSRLEVTEDLSESLANDLLGLSVAVRVTGCEARWLFRSQEKPARSRRAESNVFPRF